MRPCARSGTRTCTLTTCPRKVTNRRSMGHPGSTRTDWKGTCNPPAHCGDQGIAASMALPQPRPGPHMQPWAGAPDDLLWVPRVDLGIAIGAPLHRLSVNRSPLSTHCLGSSDLVGRVDTRVPVLVGAPAFVVP